MQNFFAQEGNLGKSPELIDVPTDDGTVKKLKLSVRFPYNVRQPNGEFGDTKGMWMTVEMWGRQSEKLHSLLQKGARVFVMGTLQDNSYVATKGDREGQTIPGLLVTAQNIALSPLGIEGVTYTQKPAAADNAAPAQDAAAPATPQEPPQSSDMSEDIEFEG
ncbi:hypothetical protein AB835_08065 [Candidatus Endobugula sertula]|uniref:Single-stranded DNA-binding protein n=1 Tax=Candidatus Endobugula sertula TaxID=62101 RepID=A0A1D2QPP2_9GAMM|nr:hypothetical protein AB835_08065 [Candidatus Endobugula sertula]